MGRLSRLLQSAGVAAVALGLISTAPVWAAAELPDPIKLTLNDWSGQLISTKIMGSVLKSAGYNVDYVQADYLAQLVGMQSGDLDVAMEIWATTGREALESAVATGKVVNLGETGMIAKEEWWVPEYTLEKCPGLPNWEALNKCAAQFATTETAPKAGLMSGCTREQVLRQVEIPLAVPEILLGVSQTIMMALSMLVITALVGTRDLGQETYMALTKADAGRGLVAGLAIAFIAIVADRLVTAWSRHRFKQLHLA